MLRLWHRIMSQGVYVIADKVDAERKATWARMIQDRIEKATILVIDECAKDVLCRTDKQTSIPCSVMPPFSAMFIEFEMPAALMVQKEVIESPGKVPTHVGVLLEKSDDIDKPDHLVATVAVCIRGVAFLELHQVYIYLRDNGHVTRIETFSGRQEEMTNWIMAPVLMSLALCHCRNVNIVDGTENIGPPRKWLQRTGQRKATYHVLKIRDNVRKIRPEDPEQDEAEKRGEHALHWVRGHFATYTEDRPLFGRLVGTFWIPEHARGDLKNGLVVKDYEVVPREIPLAVNTN